MDTHTYTHIDTGLIRGIFNIVWWWWDTVFVFFSHNGIYLPDAKNTEYILCGAGLSGIYTCTTSILL